MTPAPSRACFPMVDLQDAIVGRLGVDALRRIVVDPLHYGLADLPVDDLGDLPSSQLELVRTKFKPKRKLTAYYRATRPNREARYVVVTWAAPTPAAVQLLTFPDDPAMPHLRGFTGPHLGHMLRELTGDPPGTWEKPEVQVVRFRPGERHVLRVRSSGGRDVFVKTERDDSGALAVRVAASLGRAVTARCPGADVAEPLGFVTAGRAALWRGAPGVHLWERLCSPDAPALVGRVGAALRVVHGHDRAGSDASGWWDELQETHASAEVGKVLRAGEHIGALLPDLGVRYDRLVVRIGDALAAAPEGATVLVHGDFKTDNILVDGRRVRILDLDRVHLSEPAIDLGKLQADLRWWAPDACRWAALSGHLLAGYGGGGEVPAERVTLFAALYRLKAAARRCPVHDPDWARRVEGHVAGVESELALGSVA